MKIAAFKVAAALAFLLSAGQAVADYESCMKFCVAEHGFGHCNAVCTGGERNAGESRKANGDEEKNNEMSAQLGSCGALGDRLQAVMELIAEQFGPPYMLYTPVKDGLDIEWFPFEDGRSCKGIAIFSRNCDLTIEYQCEKAD